MSQLLQQENPVPATQISSNAVERIISASRRPSILGAAVAGAISLAMGEPDSGTPAAIIAAAIHELASGNTRYAPMTGSPELKAAVAKAVQHDHGRHATAEQIVLTHGGSAGLVATIMALVNPGDTVLIPEPTYSLYADHVAMVGGIVSWIPNRQDGSLDLGMIREQAAGARMVILCNPGNPTGRVFPESDLLALEQVLAQNPQLLLLSDEAYASITFDGLKFTSALSLEAVQDQVIGCGTFSKTYAMTGWRLGHVVASPEIAARINLIHRTINGPLNTFVQHAALTALQTGADKLRDFTDSYQKRRDIVLEHLGGLPRVSMLGPQGAFYAFVKVDSALDSVALAARFAEGGVLVRAGSEFGPSGEGHVRLSFATDPETLAEGLRRFTKVVNDLP